jgi:acyl-homoserine-lactone acylase
MAMRKEAILAGLLLLGSPALAYQAQIQRDDWGIAHITGKTDADAVFGMIYAQAEDDFNRIEMNYLTALGRRAEAEGEALIWQDLRQRLWIDPAQLQADYARSPRWLKALMQAWAAGLNQYLADHPEVKPKVITRFEPWMALSFSEGSIGGDFERVSLSQLEAFYTGQSIGRTAEESGLVQKEPLGSNGFVVAPSHSASGNALLLINPHTSFFFRSEQQVTSGEGLNAYGAATWGQFFIYQGFNQHAGWMHTSSGVDNVDEFAVAVDRQRDGSYTYRYGKAQRRVAVKPITLSYRQADGTIGTRAIATYATHHGPVVRGEGGRWIALALMHRPVAALEQSFLRTKARDLAGFLRVAERKANSSNNTLLASSKGEVALFMPQFMPRRDDRFDFTRPVDGNDPATAWQGLHRLSELPQVINPANGWAMNVNDGPWWAAGADSPKRDAFPRYLDTFGDEPRTRHAIRVLTQTRKFTLDSLTAAAYDPWLPGFAQLIPKLVNAHEAAPSSHRAQAVALLAAWDNRTGLDSVETSLAVFWGDALWARSAAAATAEGIEVEDWIATRVSQAEMLAALDEGLARLKADFGSWRVPWGEINRYQRNDGAVAQRYDDAKPSTGVPYASAYWGALASFRAERQAGTKRYYGFHGNSFVAVVEFGPRVTARAVMVGGQSGDPASPHFNDQIDRYAAGNLRPVYFWPEDLASKVKASKVVKDR